MMNDHEIAALVADTLAAQAMLNDSVGRALQAVALTTDRYDSEIAELRDEIAQLGQALAAAEGTMESYHRYCVRTREMVGGTTGSVVDLHSRKVDP